MSVSALVRSAVAYSIVLLLVGALGCSGGGEPGPEGFDVLLVTLDTTRRDRLGFHGKEGAGTPVLDRLAEEGVVFERAIAHAPITLPTHASIMTGTYPPFHGVRGNGFYRLPEARVTLAEMLSEAGYATGAVIAARVLDRRFGLAQGFSVFDDSPDEMSRGNAFSDYTRDAAAVTDAAIGVLDHLEASDPFFLWVHYFDPHAPYAPPEDLGARYPSTEEGRYQAEIANVDRELGRLLADLERRGRLDRTLIVVTADHGEGLYDPHGERTHGIFVYRDTTDIPLLFHAPGAIAGGVRRSRIVGQVDIAPTILDLLGRPEGDEMQGESLAALVRSPGAEAESGAESDGAPAGSEASGDAAPARPPGTSGSFTYSEAMVPWYKFGGAPRRSVACGRYEFIEAPEPELYDLVADPRESRNLVDGRTEVVAFLRGRLHDVLRQGSGADGFAGGLVTSEEERRKLAALGYTTTGRRVPEGEGIAALDGLKDPKRWAWVQEKIHEASGAIAAGRLDVARSTMESVIAEHPENYEAYGMLIAALTEQGDLDELERRIREALEFRPETSKLHAAWGDVERKRGIELRGRGRNEEAAAAFERAAERLERAVELEEFETDPMLRLASARFEMGRVDLAIEPLEKALEIDPRDARARAMLGTSLVMVGRPVDAVPHLLAAIEGTGPDPARQRPLRAQLLRARLDAGDAEGARETLEWLERHFPGDANVDRVRQMIEAIETGDGAGGGSGG